MRLFGRNDLLLVVGLTSALIVVFSKPVARLFDFARAVEQSRGLQLLPALAILAFVFILHQTWKRQEMRGGRSPDGFSVERPRERMTERHQA